VCSSLCTIVARNAAQNRPDNFPSCPPDNHHCSDDVYFRERGCRTFNGCLWPGNARQQFLGAQERRSPASHLTLTTECRASQFLFRRDILRSLSPILSSTCRLIFRLIFALEIATPTRHAFSGHGCSAVELTHRGLLDAQGQH